MRHDYWMGRRQGGFFERGALKYLVLDLLAERPRHGYDIIRSLEESSSGLYSPSAGAIYPTLQLLEDQGFVRSQEQDGRRVYSITEAGRAYLDENKSTVARHRERMGAFRGGRHGRYAGESAHEIKQLIRDLARAAWRAADWRAGGDPDKLRKIREILVEATGKIDALAEN